MSAEDIHAYVDYMILMHNRYSVTDSIQLMPFKYIMHSPPTPLTGKDRLGNESLEFPIGMVFGGSDYFGTEGADEIVRNNKHFQSGKSQIFKMKACSHFMPSDAPQELSELMIKFFEGKVSGCFELKPAYEMAFQMKD